MTLTQDGDRSSVDHSSDKRGMNLTLRVWRQNGPTAKGKMVTYKVTDISPDMSFLEMLDVLNEQLIVQGDDPVAFDHDCREGICGMCGVMINGQAHGPQQTTTCQLHMPQMPSRQSWSKATGSSPSRISCSLSTSSISRNDMSGETSETL